MKVFIPLMCLMSMALAEPPVGDGYPAARSSNDDIHHEHDHDHHSSGLQRSLSQDYGTPDFSARSGSALGYDYSSPNARSSLNPRGQSQFPPATVRVSFNQRFSSAASRSSDHFGPDARSQDFSSPHTRSGLSQEHNAPDARSLSQEYGLPSAAAARSLSTEYGAPNSRSSPSDEYGPPAVVAARSSQNTGSSFRSAENHDSKHGFAARSQSLDSHSFPGPSARSNPSDTPKPFSKSAFASRSAPSSTYGSPSSRSLSSTYGVPSSRSLDSDEYNQRSPSESYGSPNARSVSQEYGTPSSRSNLNTNAIVSSYATSSRSSPSSSYLPASRSAPPSEQYGTPEQRDGSGQGYDYANRARALEELLNQEPANYDFAYQIEDFESGSDFGHAETRQADRAEGSYFVVLPDGTKQTVEYEADEGGFKPRISVEPADAAARAGGYDDNAQDLSRSADGPY